MAQPKVVTIVLNWNGKSDTLECLTSLMKTNYPNHLIVVVDNHSSDDSVRTFRKQFPKVHMLENSANLGFSGGNNRGIEWALAQKADFCFVLNNDTIVEADTISRLVTTAETDNAIGAIGPLILYMEPKDKISALGGEIRWTKAEAIQGYNQEPAAQAPSEPFLTHFLTAAAVLVKREAIEKSGPLPEGYFYGMEDAAWCHHIEQAGFKLIAEPRAKIYHKESASTGHTSPIKTFYASRNALLFLKREAGIHWLQYLMTYHVKILKQTIKRLLQGDWRGLRAFWQGYFAFWQGQEGKK